MTIGYIGSYTKYNGKGIYRYELDDVQGRIKFLETGYNIEASTYLAQTDDYLYAITKRMLSVVLQVLKRKRMAL